MRIIRQPPRLVPIAIPAALTATTQVGTWKDGSAYDPKAGRSYASRIALLATGRLRVTGCVLFICRSRLWTRAP